MAAASCGRRRCFLLGSPCPASTLATHLVGRSRGADPYAVADARKASRSTHPLALCAGGRPFGRTPPASGSPATPADLADHRREAPAAELTTATRLGEHPAPVRYLKLSPDGRQLLSASGGAEGAAELRLWDIASSKLVQTFAAASAQISGLGFAPDGKRVVAASPTAIQLWDIASGHDVARQWVGEAISCFDVARDRVWRLWV